MEEVAAATALLGFDGEVSTQQAFDVITFATGAQSWSQELERRNKMLEDGRVMLAGRQVCTWKLFLVQDRSMCRSRKCAVVR